jgi:hypothetical protein
VSLVRPLLICAAALAALGGRAGVLIPEGGLWVRICADGSIVDFLSDGPPGEKESLTRPLRPGAFTLELMDGSGAVLQSREATVGAGETPEVDLR